MKIIIALMLLSTLSADEDFFDEALFQVSNVHEDEWLVKLDETASEGLLIIPEVTSNLGHLKHQEKSLEPVTCIRPFSITIAQISSEWCDDCDENERPREVPEAPCDDCAPQEPVNPEDEWPAPPPDPGYRPHEPESSFGLEVPAASKSAISSITEQ